MNCLYRITKNEEGQILPWMVFMMVLFVGFAGLTLDLGHAFVCYRELQASTDAAALAGAQNMGTSGATLTSVTNAVNNYSSLPTSKSFAGGLNANPNLSNAVMTLNFSCSTILTNKGIACISLPGLSSPASANSLQVIQTAAVPTFFIKALTVFGVKAAGSINLSTVATASMLGAKSAEYNIAMIIDTTPSMGAQDNDAECTGAKTSNGHITQISCAMYAAQQMLAGLTPCSGSASSCTASTGFDTVALFTFPNMTIGTASNDTNGNCNLPTINPYTAFTPASITDVQNSGYTDYTPVTVTTGHGNHQTKTTTDMTYQITTGSTGSTSSSTTTLDQLGFLDNYLTGNQPGPNATVNGNSPLGVAVGAGNCAGLQIPNDTLATYYAAAIYQAGAALAAASLANPGSKNAIILLTDGDANNATFQNTNVPVINQFSTSSGIYPSTIDNCAQGVAAAKWVSIHDNTAVYTVAFGSPSYGCETDTSGITPCQAMQHMAYSAGGIATPANFYSDASSSVNKGACISTVNNNKNLSLSGIFNAIRTQFTKARLIPNSQWGS